MEEAYFYALKLVDIVRHVCGFKEVLLAFSGRRGVIMSMSRTLMQSGLILRPGERL